VRHGNRQKKRVLVGHPYWGRGGAEVATMWILEALCHEFELEVVTRGGWDLDDLNFCAGTQVPQSGLRRVWVPLKLLLKQTKGGAVWDGLFRSYCRRIAPRYDLCITASRVIDWGVPAIHFLSDVAWNRDLQSRFCAAERTRSRSRSREALASVGRRLAGSSGRDPADHDLFVANSQWTAAVSKPYCRRAPAVVYPAVPTGSGWAPWEGRRNSFLYLGRIAPEKQIEQVIQILEGVRALGHTISLHVIGHFDRTPYASGVQTLCNSRASWICLHGAAFGSRKDTLLRQCRFGISTCSREAFGIATAEMMQSGIPTFVPSSGALPEVVQREELIYRDISEAIIKIDTLLKSTALQTELHRAVMSRASAFSPEVFCSSVSALVANELRRLSGAQPTEGGQ
jgi:glycosyltransferase involved in cell wall biosynthesis